RSVNFVLIAGDLFNTALPSIEGLSLVVEEFKKLQDVGIPIYLIAGSHDYSPSGKTMLEVLEKAGLFVNVSKGEEVDGKLKLKFALDKTSGVKITGILGKRSGLDRNIYEELLRKPLEEEEGDKIFMFHNLLTEFKTKEMEKVDSSPLSLLPKGFNYYAGGHVHIVEEKEVEGFGKIVYPGPLFPNSIDELEKLRKGGFFIVENWKTERIDIEIKKVECVELGCDGKSAEKVEKELKEKLGNVVVNDAIITLRLAGTLSLGKASDIHFKEIFQELYDKGAFFVMKNINKLATKEFEAISVEKGNVEEIEEKLIKEHLGQIKIDGDEAKLVRDLMDVLSNDKLDGERVTDYEDRVKEEVKKIIKF
ncbi:MAG: DNA repair exonuclease, partial [Candidatus Woesearchaeota archaeon]|nr:DNA repair exonuclease [Candidatus Woesearchaeota archaeon]